MTEPQAETARRGRPRPQETIDRDAAVLAHVPADGTSVTRRQLAEATGMPENAVYLSLFRLHRDGEIERVREGGSHTWKRITAVAA